MNVSCSSPHRRLALAASVAGLVLIPLALSGCGGGTDAPPECGDGIHQPASGEQCDDGNEVDGDSCSNSCRANLPTSTTIAWVFNEAAAPMFDNDSCSDVRAFRVEVTVTGPTTVTQDESCSLRQVVFQNLPAGEYKVEIKPLDLDGGLLIDAPVEVVTDLGAGTMLMVDVPPDRWLRSYLGTFFFRTLFDGQDCSSASPPVTQHRLTMEQGGSVLTLTTETGDPLNGSGPGDCQLFGEEFPQSALMVPFGDTTFTVEGLDSGGTVQFSETFETFVGAGISNPELHFDVDPVSSVDGA